MLESLYVKNLALIDQAEVNFTEGLNILSGETGAGKSILIGSVLTALGQKAQKGLIRKNQTEAYVELTFHLVEENVCQKLAELGIQPEDERLIITRRLTETKSVCRVNGEQVPASLVRSLAPLLIDIHGQHEHQTLMKKEKQLELLDRYGREKTAPLLEKTAQLHKKYHELLGELKKRTMDEAERLRMTDILTFEYEELSGAQIRPGEEKQLEEEWKRCRNAARIRELVQTLQGLLSADGGGAADLAASALQYAKELSSLDSSAESLVRELADAEAILQDCGRELSNRSEQEDGGERMEEISGRLDQLRRLMQKYNCGEEGLVALAEEKRTELENYRSLDEIRKKLKAKTLKARSLLEEVCEELGAARREYAALLEKQLIGAMQDLNFPDVRFEIRLSKTAEMRANGREEAEFFIAVNPGEDLKPLSAVASGGELSRIMLAFKSVLAKQEETGTLIFDEIDAGISGRTAQKVADRLSEIARGTQVICISHLPQIVSFADTHFLIHKEVEGQVTSTHITALQEEESIRELARLLSGSEITKSVLDNAAEMRKLARRGRRDQTG